MNGASTFQLGEIFAGITVLGLMISVPLILIFVIYKFSKRSDK